MDAPIELLKAARMALGFSQEHLAELSQLSPRTVYLVERGKAKLESTRMVQSALEKHGVTFINPGEPNGPGINVKFSPKG